MEGFAGAGDGEREGKGIEEGIELIRPVSRTW